MIHIGMHIIQVFIIGVALDTQHGVFTILIMIPFFIILGVIMADLTEIILLFTTTIIMAIKKEKTMVLEKVD